MSKSEYNFIQCGHLTVRNLVVLVTEREIHERSSFSFRGSPSDYIEKMVFLCIFSAYLLLTRFRAGLLFKKMVNDCVFSWSTTNTNRNIYFILGIYFRPDSRYPAGCIARYSVSGQIAIRCICIDDS
jgi:hypothetical protein